MAPKKKAQKMALADFFNDEATGGSWADELGDLPTAPAPKDPNAGPRRGEAGYLDSMPDRSSRPGFSGPPREEIPIPSAPPYTAFVGNLTFETDEAALREFFGDCKPVSARIMKNPQGEAKGFGYVEFETVDGLKEALARTESNLGGRTIRVSVAEPPSSRKDFAPSAADEASQWRRATPLPAREAAAPPARRGGSYSDSPAGGAGVERDWGAARGARFTPAPPTPLGGGLRRDSSGPGREREFREPREPSQADEAGQWRSARPLVEAVAAPSGGPGGARRDAPPHVAGGGQSSPGLADTEQTWSRGTKLRTPVTSEPARSGTASPAGEDRDWRSSRATSAVPSTDGDNSPRQAPAAPAERRKLALAPRSVPATPSSATSPDSTTAAPSSGKSIFGAAKPIDTAAREREAAAKMAARDAERKKAREEEAKREEDKAKKLSDDRARAIKEAQDKAMAAVTGRPVPKARQTSTGAQGAGAAAKKRGPGQVGEDGFEQVAGKGARAPVGQQERPGQGSRKESTTRTGFSFAAAAGGIAGQDEDDEGKDGVEDVTNGVKEVAV